MKRKELIKNAVVAVRLNWRITNILAKIALAKMAIIVFVKNAAMRKEHNFAEGGELWQVKIKNYTIAKNVIEL